MSTIDEVRHANLLELIARFPTLQAFADAIERSHSQVSQLKTRARHSSTGTPQSIGDKMARHIEQRLGLPRGWMDAPKIGEKSQRYGANVGIIDAEPASNAVLLDWSALVPTDDLPAVFRVAMPDDSMAPRVRRGDIVRFSRDAQARPGDGVLVSDAQGQLFFRVYRQAKPGAWEAQPLNDAYTALHSDRDGLRVVAVLVGIDQQRWG
jgi:hypothetical protein